ncbi:MAG: homoserine dehydrogenase [Clostridiales bacterium]|jgi:homoserine dehydrogenase|nr:homoserine dehydrogenase [Clostridiales bacterium]
MAEIAILGYGVVGSGVLESLRINRVILEKKAGQPLHVKKVLDLRSFPGDPVEPILTREARDILEDKEIDIIAEVMGGLSPAYEFHQKALSSGKHIVTSNKELVSQYGAELLALAKQNHVSFLFEASVGGGIPIIRPLNQTLTTENISQIAGILNGTTNYILSHMQSHGLHFTEALRQAQEKGYAERDPSADVEGYDACRKLAILLSLSVGRHVRYEDIHTEGISALEKEDFLFADLYGDTIKLIAKGDIFSEYVEASVAPSLVSRSSIFSSVSDVYNAIMVTSNITDNILFYGRGAGKLPAAGAVVSDIVEAARNCHGHIRHDWSPEVMPAAPFEEAVAVRRIRISYQDENVAKREAESIFGSLERFIVHEELQQAVFATPPMKEKDFKNKLALLARVSGVSFKNALRVFADR